MTADTTQAAPGELPATKPVWFAIANWRDAANAGNPGRWGDAVDEAIRAYATEATAALREDFAAMRQLVINGGAEAARREAEIAELRAALTAREAAAPAPSDLHAGWRTMESAPKAINHTFDKNQFGKRVLLRQAGIVNVGHWWQRTDGPTGCNWLSDCGNAMHPDGWLPLPLAADDEVKG